MSLLSEMIHERREWATSRGVVRRSHRRVQALELLLAMSLLVLAFLIYQGVPGGFQQVVGTGIEYVRQLGQSMMHLLG